MHTCDVTGKPVDECPCPECQCPCPDCAPPAWQSEPDPNVCEFTGTLVDHCHCPDCDPGARASVAMYDPKPCPYRFTDFNALECSRDNCTETQREVRTGELLSEHYPADGRSATQLDAAFRAVMDALREPMPEQHDEPTPEPHPERFQDCTWTTRIINAFYFWWPTL